jgi:hypothetical protein
VNAENESRIMPRIAFDDLPPRARLWIFSASRPLSEAEGQRVLAEVDAFIERWAAHGTPLTAGRDLRYGQFVFIAVDVDAADASGCSVDALVRRMRQLGEVLGVELVNNAPVMYRDGDAITRVPRERFAELVDAGVVALDSVVFDNTLTSVGDLRAGRWELPAGEAWHRRAFFPAGVSS